MAKKRKKYIDYDYDASFNKSMDDLAESDIERKLEAGIIKSIYATKKIKSGDQLEVEIYPEFSRKQEIIENGYVFKDLKAKRKLNDKNSRKHFIRLVNTNFTNSDLMLTLTYSNDQYPKDMKKAQRNIANYIQKVNYHRKKRGLSNARYVYVTEWIKKKTGAVRCHHHIIIDGEMTGDELESMWKKGRRNQIRKLNMDEDSLTGIATYLSKATSGGKRYCQSLNLKKPKETKDHQTFRMKQIREMVWDHTRAGEIVGEKFKGYNLRESKVFYNDMNGRYYIYVRMHKRGDDDG